MRFLLALIIGIAIGAGAIWYMREHRDKTPFQQAGDRIESATKSTRDTIQDKLHSLNLNGDTIKEELAKTGRVIREKSQQAGKAISDATADARVTAAIKAKLVRDSGLSAWNISVNTTDGVVTLSGTVSSPEDIGKAMVLALETDGAQRVISTLQVKPKS
jgi:hyperosmotically inducible protein